VIADVLASQLPVPDRIISSSAVRAIQTIDRILRRLSELSGDRYPDYEIEPELYLADAMGIRGIAYDALRRCDHVWVCAHNPGVTEMIPFCTESTIDNVPTLGIVRIELDDDLTEGELVYFDTPRNYR
jgi:phosphohistidine phosphatase